MRQKFFALLFVGLLILGLFVVQHIGERAEVGEVDLSQGMTKVDLVAVPFRLPDIEGKERGLKDFAGEFVLVHFWASWCAPCIDEIPQMVDFAKKVEGLPLRVVAITLDSSWRDAEKILKMKGLPEKFVSVIDQDQAVSKAYGSFQFPETYLVSPESRVVTKWVGPQKWNSPEVVAWFRSMVTQPIK